MMRILLYDSFGAPSGICRNFISRKEFIRKLNRNVGKILGIAFVARRPPLVLRSRASVDDCLMWMEERVPLMETSIQFSYSRYCVPMLLCLHGSAENARESLHAKRFE